jgi:hypothetical protein
MESITRNQKWEMIPALHIEEEFDVLVRSANNSSFMGDPTKEIDIRSDHPLPWQRTHLCPPNMAVNCQKRVGPPLK